MEKSRKDKGITLIALIITIIVLLILALVTINAIQGDDSLIAHANNAGTKYRTEGEKENTVVTDYLALMLKENGGNVSTDEEDDENKYIDLNWTYSEDYTTITGLSDQGKALIADGPTSLSMPDTANGVTITAISDYAFIPYSAYQQYYGYGDDIYMNLNISKLPLYLEEIGSLAFLSNPNIIDITIPITVNNIGTGAFASCSALKNVTILGPTNIGASAFKECSNLETITWELSSEITDEIEIGNYAFNWCKKLSFTSGKLPEQVVAIGECAFIKGLCLYFSKLPDNLETLGESAFEDANLASTLSISENLTNIGKYALCNCDITAITYGGYKSFWENITTSIFGTTISIECTDGTTTHR